MRGWGQEGGSGSRGGGGRRLDNQLEGRGKGGWCTHNNTSLAALTGTYNGRLPAAAGPLVADPPCVLCTPEGSLVLILGGYGFGGTWGGGGYGGMGSSRLGGMAGGHPWRPTGPSTDIVYPFLSLLHCCSRQKRSILCNLVGSGGPRNTSP